MSPCRLHSPELLTACVHGYTMMHRSMSRHVPGLLALDLYRCAEAPDLRPALCALHVVPCGRVSCIQKKLHMPKMGFDNSGSQGLASELMAGLVVAVIDPKAAWSLRGRSCRRPAHSTGQQRGLAASLATSRHALCASHMRALIVQPLQSRPISHYIVTTCH